jgi:hypothetical protein
MYNCSLQAFSSDTFIGLFSRHAQTSTSVRRRVKQSFAVTRFIRNWSGRQNSIKLLNHSRYESLFRSS